MRNEMNFMAIAAVVFRLPLTFLSATIIFRIGID